VQRHLQKSSLIFSISTEFNYTLAQQKFANGASCPGSDFWFYSYEFFFDELRAVVVGGCGDKFAMWLRRHFQIHRKVRSLTLIEGGDPICELFLG